ncbi:class I SAM-dependent methyltransferase [Pseudooceanicola antarcticus]|uniref:Class I SAM-dependent methyltransferase n=1 Tax=Pseudooceanicola antarcticus TaxID=1247613 RepID=A0ABX4MRT3_9RHOB|nr:class I SAM-dependent methyltransferase [Pseudooceanicola antarcticus]
MQSSLPQPDTPSESNFAAARQFVAHGRRKQAEEGRESISGPGSGLEAAQPTMKLLDRVLEERQIRSILDLGCGDWNWMRHMGLAERKISYRGWDADPDLIASLTRAYGEGARIRFEMRDLTSELLPPHDLVIIRDVLFHLPHEMAQRVITRIRNASRYMIATSFFCQGQNPSWGDCAPVEIEGWGFYTIDLCAPPFSLTPFLAEALREPLCTIRGKPRYVCLFDFGSKP